MPKLYILRHAEAENDFSMSDHKRSLTEYGVRQAIEIGKNLNDIDIAISSSATRTKQTLENAVSQNQSKKIEFLDDLYNASADQLLQTVQSQDAQNILIVAHNPGIHMFAHQLANKNEASSHLDNLSTAYPPCTLTILECDIESWSELEYQRNKLLDYIAVTLPR